MTIWPDFRSDIKRSIDTADFSNAVPDEIFEKIVSIIRIAVPYTGMIISTRESIYIYTADCPILMLYAVYGVNTFHKNKHIPRKKLTQEEIRQEVIALQDMGHKRLAIEAGEDPVNNPIEYILESITTNGSMSSACFTLGTLRKRLVWN